MMFASLSQFLILAQLMGPMSMAANAANPPKPESAPTSQPAAATDARPANAGPADGTSAYMAKLKAYLNGEKTLSAQEVVQFQFWLDAARDLVFATLGFIPRLFVALILLMVFWVIYRAVRRLVLGSMGKAHVDQSIRDMLGHLIKWSIMGFGIVIACNQVGIQITALLTGVSIIGLAVGFAAQETLANFIAGIVIFWDRPFKVGDWIQIDGTFGQVQRVTFRSTRILNIDGEVIVLPNTYMLANKVSNHTANPINRINIPIGIAYKESIDDARAALLALTTGDTRLCNDPPPQVVVSACADSSVNLILRMWIFDESLERMLFHEYMEKAKKALDAAGIEIPFPHMQLFIEDTPAVAMLARKPSETRAA
jgi:small conductance mechanosensitive channel